MRTRGAVLALIVLCTAVPVSAEGREDAKLARATSRCSKQGELLACYEALNLRPNDAGLLVAEADALVQSKRPGEAIGVYRNALTIGANRESVESKIGAAQSLRQSLLDGCLTQAGRAAERACESAWLPGAADEVDVFKRRGLLLQRDEQPAAALEAYLAAARCRPRDRDTARAVVNLTGTTDRRDALALAALGTAQMTLGHRGEAITAWRQALRMSPNLQMAKEGLRTAKRIGNPAAASGIAAAANPAPAGAAGAAAEPGVFSNEAQASRSN